MLLARWQGVRVRALLGLVVSLIIVIFFVAPSILDGNPPILVALVGSLAVMAVTMSLTHGPGLKCLTAMLGTARCASRRHGGHFLARSTPIEARGLG